MTLLVVTIVVALAFDFTNGFHDTANAVATSVSTRALSPRMAVLIAAIANLAGAFATTAVAKTVGQGIIDTGPRDAEDGARRGVGCDRVEPAHVVARAAVVVVARADRRPDRRCARPVRRSGRRVARHRSQGGDPGAVGAHDRVRCGVPAAARDLLGFPVAHARESPTAPSGSDSCSRVRGWHSRTARTTRRRRWA